MVLMKKRTSRIALTLVMSSLLLSACSGKSTNSPTASPSATGNTATTPAADPKLSKDPITLKVFIGGADTEKGIQTSAVAEEIKKRFGITLDFITGDDVKEKTMIAGGDLPDVILTMGSVTGLIDSMIQGGQVIQLDDLVKKYAPNIQKYTPGGLEVMRKSASNNTDKVYFLPVRITKAYDGSLAKDGFVGFNTRWDLYKGIGAPEMKNEDDFLKVMKQIQDKNPTTKDGKKTYSFSAWAGELFPYIITYPFSMGYGNFTGNTSVNFQTGEVVDNFMQKDGVFWNGIKFFNKAYRMGLFDPEGFTQKLEQYVNKINTGQVFNSAASFWMGESDLIKNTGIDNAQLLQLPGPFPGYANLYPVDNPTGNNLSPAHAITSRNKYPERTMQLFDFLSSPEGGRLVYSGIKGKDWDIVNGKPQLIGMMAKPLDPGYADYVKSVGTNKLTKLTGLADSYPAEDGFPLDLKLVIDPTTVTKAEKEFAVHFGADLYPGQVYDKLVKAGKGVTNTKFFPFIAFMKQPSETTTQTFTKAEQYFMANVARFIMAKDDAAFNEAQQKALDDFKAMGVDKAYAEMHKLVDDSTAFAKTIKMDK